ncbi:MAG TPA: addiction module protein [Opitutaceae bacterium]|jgi:putative addiction module component (TIGR02574 family)|nr:addiction module protein [Opitutaceae bacterium]
MQIEQLTREVMLLPVAERVGLAQALWQSIDCELAEKYPDNETATIKLAEERDAELASGKSAKRSHEQVMQAARRAL